MGTVNKASKSQPAQPVIRLEAIVVEGQIKKPQAFYILQRASLNMGPEDLQKSFIPKIFQAVEQKPF